MPPPPVRAIRSRLLRWFDAHRRDLPWRRTTDPYRILVAEFLLQRTRVASGKPYYERFLARFPDVGSLAAASEDDVLRTWEGIGFYRRARNLHRAAKAITERAGGEVPETAAALEGLPGVGPYTAGAVASVAFGERVPAVDGNATRVLSRLFLVESDVTRGEGRDRIRALAIRLVPPSRPGDFNQALMELGATVCAPRVPRCPACPLENLCLARGEGVEATVPRPPRRSPARKVPVGFVLMEVDDRILLVRRPVGGLLGGLWSLPGGEIFEREDPRSALAHLVGVQTGLRARVAEELSPIDHAFSHRRWVGAIYRAKVAGSPEPTPPARWFSRGEIPRVPVVRFQREVLDGLRLQPRLDAFDAGRS